MLGAGLLNSLRVFRVGRYLGRGCAEGIQDAYTLTRKYVGPNSKMQPHHLSDGACTMWRAGHRRFLADLQKTIYWKRYWAQFAVWREDVDPVTKEKAAAVLAFSATIPSDVEASTHSLKFLIREAGASGAERTVWDMIARVLNHTVGLGQASGSYRPLDRQQRVAHLALVQDMAGVIPHGLLDVGAMSYVMPAVGELEGEDDFAGQVYPPV